MINSMTKEELDEMYSQACVDLCQASVDYFKDLDSTLDRLV